MMKPKYRDLYMLLICYKWGIVIDQNNDIYWEVGGYIAGNGVEWLRPFIVRRI